MSTHFVTLETNRGAITAELFDRDCPATVEHFERLVRDGFYAGTGVYHVEPGALVKAGDQLTRVLSVPRADAALDDTVVPGEVIGNRNRPEAGALAMVPNADGTSGSRFALVLDDDLCDVLRTTHTVFAQVTDGMEVARTLQRGDVILDARIIE